VDIEDEAVLERRNDVVSSKSELRHDAEQPVTIHNIAAGAAQRGRRWATSETAQGERHGAFSLLVVFASRIRIGH
jgi:hypothetical protein